MRKARKARKGAIFPVLGLLLWAPSCNQPQGPAPGDVDGGLFDLALPAEITFATQVVDDNASGASLAIVIDPTGAPHVLYLSGGAEMNCNLGGTTTKYRAGQLWHATPMAGAFGRVPIGTPDVEAAGLSALIDPKTGLPVVTFQGGKQGLNFCGGSDMVLSRYRNGAWTRTEVADKSTAGVGAVETAGEVVGAWSALAIGKSGTWYLAYQDVHSGNYQFDDLRKADLEFVSGMDGNLRAALGTTESVIQLGFGVYNSMALSRTEQPVLAFSGYNADPGIKVALRTAPKTWRVTDVATGGQVRPSLAASPAGKLGIAFYDVNLKVLRLRESDDGVVWGPLEVIDRDGDVGRVVSLKYDDAGRPVVAYYSCGTYRGNGCDPFTDALRVARREPDGQTGETGETGETWKIGTVDTGADGSCGAELALALGPDGKAHVAYQCNEFHHGTGQFRAQVKYATER